MKIGEAIELLEGMIYERNAIISYSSELPEIYIKEKVALEEAVKVLKRYNQLVQVKARPVKQHIKIQYEGEELTIKELVDRLHKYKFLFRFWKEEAEKAMKVADELRKMYADYYYSKSNTSPVKHGQWKLVGKIYDGKADIWKCTVCGGTVMILTDDCPYCGAKMDGGEDDGI